jgi:hypothetical protein
MATRLDNKRQGYDAHGRMRPIWIGGLTHFCERRRWADTLMQLAQMC